MVTVRELKARLSLTDTTFTMGMSKAASATNRLQRNLQNAATNLVTFESTLKGVDLSGLKGLLAFGTKKLAISFSLDWKAMRDDINAFIDANGGKGRLKPFKDLQLNLDWKYLRDQINDFVDKKGAKDKRMKEFKGVEFDASLKGGSNESLEVLKAIDGKLNALNSIFNNISNINASIEPATEAIVKAIENSGGIASILGVK